MRRRRKVGNTAKHHNISLITSTAETTATAPPPSQPVASANNNAKKTDPFSAVLRQTGDREAMLGIKKEPEPPPPPPPVVVPPPPPPVVDTPPVFALPPKIQNAKNNPFAPNKREWCHACVQMLWCMAINLNMTTEKLPIPDNITRRNAPPPPEPPKPQAPTAPVASPQVAAAMAAAESEVR